jgi:hypothetical protein
MPLAVPPPEQQQQRNYSLFDHIPELIFIVSVWLVVLLLILFTTVGLCTWLDPSPTIPLRKRLLK